MSFSGVNILRLRARAHLVFHWGLYSKRHNRIYNKLLYRDWLSARLFVRYLARDHVGVQLNVFDSSFLKIAYLSLDSLVILRQLRAL